MLIFQSYVFIEMNLNKKKLLMMVSQKFIFQMAIITSSRAMRLMPVCIARTFVMLIMKIMRPSEPLTE